MKVVKILSNYDIIIEDSFVKYYGRFTGAAYELYSFPVTGFPDAVLEMDQIGRVG